MSDFLFPALGIAVARDSFGLDGIQNTADMPEIMGKRRTARAHGGMYGRRDSGQFMRKDESSRDVDDGPISRAAGRLMREFLQPGRSGISVTSRENAAAAARAIARIVGRTPAGRKGNVQAIEKIARNLAKAEFSLPSGKLAGGPRQARSLRRMAGME